MFCLLWVVFWMFLFGLVVVCCLLYWCVELVWVVLMFGGECGYCVVDSSRLFSLMTFFKCYYTVGNFVCYV